MDDKTKIPLTASEMSMLWTQYVNDTASICVNSFFLEKAEDEEIRPVIEFALSASKDNVSFLKDFFINEKFPVPVGFTDKDVDTGSPKLFSDTFVLVFLRHMSIIGMGAASAALGFVTRPDIVTFFKTVHNSGVGLQDLTRDLMLKQGTYLKAPYISTPDKVDFVEKQHFLAGFIGKKRPLTAHEITILFNNVQTNTVGKALITGFAQTAKHSDVVDYFLRGRKMAQKHIDIFSGFLKDEDLPVPITWDTALTDSTFPAFSDKLMMFHVSAMTAAGIGNYGASISGSPRRDLALQYGTLIPETALFAEDGANIMIKHGWLEEPPQSDDRGHLIKGE